MQLYMTFEAFRFQKRTASRDNEISHSKTPGPVPDRNQILATPIRPDTNQQSCSTPSQSLDSSVCTPPTITSRLVNGQKSSSGKKRKLSKEEVFDDDLDGLPERLGDNPLRLIIVGTNPSGHAWKSGHYYSNPSNHMWRVLKAAEITPPHITGPQDDIRMPSDVGVGFLDLGYGNPGTHSSKFSSSTMQSWASDFYERLKAHVERASKSIGCSCGNCGEPSIMAFAGKRQWMELLNADKFGKNKFTRIEAGVQSERPKGWPFSHKTEVWVMPSTSGAAPMTIAERYEPYKVLGQHFKTLLWPREMTSCCCSMPEQV